MYDTIGLNSHYQNSYELTKYFNVKKEFADKNGVVNYSGRLDNLEISVKDNFFTCQGSLPAFYLGNNYESLNKEDTGKALEKLSDMLHVKIDDSNLHRIDIGCTFPLKYPIGNYTKNLLHLVRFKKVSYDSSIYFKKRNMELAFYDKGHEMKVKKKGEVDNCLRYELRLTGGANINKITGFKSTSQLTSEKHYNGLIELWFNHYYKITKIKDSKVIEEKDMKGRKEILWYLATFGLQKFGADQLLNIVQGNRTNLTAVQFDRLKKTIIELINTPTQSLDLVDEMDRRVNEQKNFYKTIN